MDVDGGPLASLLGDTEGPAHDDWSTSNDRADATWRDWRRRVKFVRGIVDALAEVLEPPSDAPDFDLLSDFFAFDRVDADPRPRAAPGAKSSQAGRLAELAPAKRWYRIHDRAGGFTLSPSNDLPVPIGARLRVSLAYDLPSGDALKRWSKFDFDVGAKTGPIKAKLDHVKAKATAGNVVELRVEADAFKFTLGGFDVNRDVFVRVDELDEPTDGEVTT